MNASHLCTIIVLAVFLTLPVPGSAYAGTTAGDRILTGELVVTNAAKNQFRLVERRGSFTAPAGTRLESLEGKPVEVELGRDGRVLQISLMPIHIEPVTHGFEVITGELVLQDPVTRRFGVAGDPRTYTLPQGIDAGQYAGRLIEMRLDEQGGVMSIDLIGRSADAPVSRATRQCMAGDLNFASGASICRSGRTLRCADGVWVNVGTACAGN